MYHNLMNKFKWGEVDRAESMYLDESLMRMCLNLRIQFAKLATELIKLGRNEEAIKALDKCMAGLPEHNVRYGSVMAQFADLYLKAGGIDKGEALAKRLDELYSEKMEYYIRHKGNYSGTFRNDFEDGLRVFNSLTESLKKYSTDKEYTASISTKFNDYIKRGQEYMRR
jgi:tetratricopeptide (TPR) repeat protein